MGRGMEQTKEPESDPTHYNQIIFDNSARKHTA